MQYITEPYFAVDWIACLLYFVGPVFELRTGDDVSGYSFSWICSHPQGKLWCSTSRQPITVSFHVFLDATWPVCLYGFCN